MKTNLKSGNAIVRLLLAHGEKLGILAILVCTGLIVWSAIGRERIQRTPSELENLARDAKAHLARFTWDQLEMEDKKMAEPVSESAMVKIPVDSFPNIDRPFNPPISDPISLRTDPVLLAPTDLEVNSDSGLWASANPEVIKRKTIEALKEIEEKQRELKVAQERAKKDQGRGGPRGVEGGLGFGDRLGAGVGGQAKAAKDAPIIRNPRTGAQLQGYEEITAKSWVTVLARVPYEQQNQQYEDALASSKGYNKSKDYPRYLGYQIERAEVTSKGQGEWVQIKFVTKKSLEEEISTYPVNVPDVIDPDVRHPLLTHALPPLILREWGERVSHSSMPLAEEKARLEAEALADPAEEEEPVEAPSEDDPFADDDRDLTARTRGPQGEFGGRGGYGAEFGGGEFGGYGGGEFGGYGGGEFGGYGGEFGGGEFGGFGGGFRGSLGQGSGVKIEKFVWDGETSHVLFRFFDNTVKPGHSYRYRVRLAMRDVNHKVKEQYLDKAVTQRREESGNKVHRWTEWSEPSPIASVPLPARIYLVGARPAKDTNFNSEPSAELMVKALNSEHAAEVARHESFDRGNVINVVDKAKVIWASKIDDLENPEFQFLTGITVLDCTGGKKLGRSKDLLKPARALMMDAAGHLFVQQEMDDIETVEEYETILEEGKDTRNRGSRGGFGSEYGGEFGGGEFGGYGEF